MARQVILFTFFLLFLFLFLACERQHPEKSIEQDTVEVEIPPYARHLKGFKICLDPGHGGQGHIPGYKRGPTGLREAEINLKVANYLKKLLEQAEATVIMTRVDDSYISLADRSQIANENHADFFISLHHNGIDNNPQINYTSTWYHGDADESRPSLNLARYIQHEVSNAMRLPKSASTGLYSDKLIVASGFGVLRLTKCPAVVCEASFYTNPEEEARLKQDVYLKREASGYFLGIARYVEAGFPKGVLITPEHESDIQTKTPTLKIQVKDGLHERGAWMLKRQQVFTNAMQVKIDNVNVPFKYDRDKDIITVHIKEPLSNGMHLVQTELVNYYGNHSLPKPQQFKVAPPAAKLKLSAWTDTLPYDGKSYVGITVTALDADGMPIADNELIKAKTTKGTLVDTKSLSKGGTSHFYLQAPEKPGTATVEAVYGQTRNSLKINFADITNGILQGQVSDANSGNPIPDVELNANSGLSTTTDTEGHYFIKTDSEIKKSFETTLHFSKPGFYPDKHQISVEPNKATIFNAKLHAIADGAFAKTVLVLDSKTNTSKTHQLIIKLKEMLELAGAKIHVVHTPGEKVSTEKRIENVNNIEDEGYYLQINHIPQRKGKPSVVGAHNHGNQGTETFQKRILEQFNQKLFEIPIVTVQDRETPVIQQTNKMAMTLEIQTLDYPDTTTDQEASAIFIGAWLFLKEETEIDTKKLERFMLYLRQARGE
ncbi:MAG: N-acetylmuramoyl-L-alanine amidase [Candidatus Poribacteria bacterium]|nr:N-acetylmuramoyl-L-alanine amidase [Candidatus Poribacteria bacterium]